MNWQERVLNWYDENKRSLPWRKTKDPYKVWISEIILQQTKVAYGTKYYDIFDNDKFWEVVREWSKNNYVFISETSAPEDFIAVWEKDVHRSASQSSKTRYKNNSEKNKTEKLYIHKSVHKRLNL